MARRKPPLRDRSPEDQRRWVLKQEDQAVRRALRIGLQDYNGFIPTRLPSRGRRTKASGRQKNEAARRSLDDLFRACVASGQVGSFTGFTVIESIQDPKEDR